MSRHQTSRFFMGIILVLLGIGFLLNTLAITDFNHVLSIWWPSIIILFGLAGLFSDRGNKTGPFIIFLIGSALQLWRLDIIRLDIWALIWPVILIIIGISLLSGHRRSVGTDSQVFAAFSGNESKVSSEKPYEQGNLTAIFGGAKIDLRKVELAENAELHVTVAFGGGEVLVPENCAVSIQALPLFGGCDDKSEHPESPTQTLTIRGTVLFGGLEVKN